MKIIPAIDLKDGCCVRLYKGDFDRVTQYSSKPAEVAQAFSLLGCSDLHVVDLDGAKSGCQKNQKSIRAIVEACDMSIQLGGGIRQADTLQNWFDAGVKRCVIGSTVVTDPDLVRQWIRTFSSERIVLALDVTLDDAALPRLATHGWLRTSEVSLWDCIESFQASGLRHVLCTDVGRDGALQGPNLQLYEQIMQRYPDLLLQASGGVRHIDDLRRAAATGAAATVTGRALLDGRIDTEEIASFPQSA